MAQRLVSLLYGLFCEKRLRTYIYRVSLTKVSRPQLELTYHSLILMERLIG